DGDYVAAQVSIIDTASRSVFASVRLPNGSTGLRGVCVSPDGAFAYVTHILGRYQLPTTQLERGWMNTNALSVIDVKAGTLVNTLLLDDVDLGAANPWGVACTADGKYVCVAHAGTHEISVIDRPALHEKLTKAAAGEKVSDVSSSAEDVPNDLAFLVDIRRRVTLKGNGPRGLAIAGSKVYAAEYFSDSLGCLDLTSARANPATSIPLGPGGEMTVARRGEMLFNDAQMCFQHWQSCTSCHPDARADGLNWDLLNDGIGNPKNTKSMLLAHQTPPVMARGVRDKAETAVRSGMKFIQFAVRPEEDAAAIDEYLKSMTPVPSPVPDDGEATKRGEAVFNKAGCAACHPAPLYTDLQKYDLGMGLYSDAGQPFDTPTLIEVWRTAPYLHDGRAATIHDMLTIHNPGDKHGKTSNLTEQELNDLAQFIMTR
ncbi:MAG: c-type cytochrome, partial [Candidatus Hydrogenedentes bacterium]|nr:c-type cytochrome [Candidatus Hydrogenedentota bacterium]